MAGTYVIKLSVSHSKTNADGSGQTQITFNATQELTPSWSPDGEQIVFHGAPGNQLFVMDANGTGEKRLTIRPAST